MAEKNKSQRKGKFSIIIVIVTSILDLLLIYITKYSHQELSLTNFKLSIIGNLLNLFFAFSLILGVLIIHFKKKLSYNPLVVINTIILMNIVLLTAIFITLIEFELPKIYYLHYSNKEVITGALFSVYLYIHLFLIFYIWNRIFELLNYIFLRTVIHTSITLLVLFLFSFFYTQSQRFETLSRKENDQQVNIAVVLGAAVWRNNIPSPSLAARADKAVELFFSGDISKIQLTGSNAPGELSEAEVAYKYLISKQIDSSIISTENNTTSTTEQIHFIKEKLLPYIGSGKVIIVSDSYHLTRIKEICKFYNVRSEVVSSELDQSLPNKLTSLVRESIGLLLFWFFAL